MNLTILTDIKSIVNKTPFLQFMFNASKALINIFPFYLVEEMLLDKNSQIPTPKIDKEKMETFLMDKTTAKQISTHPEVLKQEKAILSDLKDHWNCIGLRYDDEIIAYMFCNLEKIKSTFYSSDLKSDEAYLSYARTFSAFRGKNLAPYLRCKMYDHLKKIKRTHYYSITEYFNKPAIRFKEKLNVKPLKLMICLVLFRKIKIIFCLKKFQ